ncbi:MAG: four helix bundle protein [Acidobacteria bacterium]|nr:four helix bundle protein [Acidobacteriota bacterium]
MNAWQKARALTREVYRVTQGDGFRQDFGLRDQARRAAVSVMANVAEGFERHRLGEFKQYLSVAKASCAELRSHLYVALDVGYLAQHEFEQVSALANETTRVIAGLRSSIARPKQG